MVAGVQGEHRSEEWVPTGGTAPVLVDDPEVALGLHQIVEQKRQERRSRSLGGERGSVLFAQQHLTSSRPVHVPALQDRRRGGGAPEQLRHLQPGRQRGPEGACPPDITPPT